MVEPGGASAALDDRANDEQAEIPVVVAVHIRPLIEDELYSGCRECLAVTEGEAQVCCGHHTFNFDQVYGGGGLVPSRLYGDCVEPLVQGVFSGYNATVFAYGQTGSGKTYTMGSQFSPDSRPHGIIPDALQSMFARIEAEADTSFTLRIGFIEIHKEEIHDLLLLPGQPQPVISIREMPNGSMCVAGATEIDIDLAQGGEASKAHVFRLLLQGTMARATSMTLMNARSSRSHAVFSLTLEQRRPSLLDATDVASEVDGERENSSSSRDEKGDNGPDMSYLCAKMLLVDLAGSERVKRTGATGARLQEGIHINQGLLSLANVIQALVDGHKHVPYRNSKLTRLLQDSLGHNSRTVMVACVSPADSNMEETINTLRYANRARNIKNKPVVNRDPSAAQILLLRQQLSAARAEISVLRGQMSSDARDGKNAGSAASSGTNEHLAMLQRQLAESQSHVAHLLAQRSSSLSAAGPSGSNGETDRSWVDRVSTLQSRVLELEAQVERTTHLGSTASGVNADGRASIRPTLSSHMLPLHTLHEADTGELSPDRFGSGHEPDLQAHDHAPLWTEAEHREHLRHVQEEQRLREEVRRKEEQLKTLTVGPQAVETKQRQDQLMTQLTQARRAHVKLRKDLEVAETFQHAQKVKHSKEVKRQRKELEDMGQKIRKIEAEQHRMEVHMNKKDALVNRLKTDISRKASEVAGKHKQIMSWQQRYETLKKGNARQISDLRRDNKRVEHENQRLKLVNEKRQQVIARKMKEAEEAKKRLAAIERRQHGRGPANSLRSGSTMSALHTAPAGSMGAPAPHLHLISQPLPPAQALDSSLGHHGPPPGLSAFSGPLPSARCLPEPEAPRPVRPNSVAPELPDAKAMEEWIREELDAASTAHDTRLVLDGTLAKRGDIKHAYDKAKAELAEIDALPKHAQIAMALRRCELEGALERMHDEMETCSRSIAALHSQITAAVQQNVDARTDEGAARFALIRDPKPAQQLLAVLFHVACDAHGECLAMRAENAESEDAGELLKLQIAEWEEKCAKEVSRSKALEAELAAALAALSEARGLGGSEWGRHSAEPASEGSLDMVNTYSPTPSPSLVGPPLDAPPAPPPPVEAAARSPSSSCARGSPPPHALAASLAGAPTPPSRHSSPPHKPDPPASPAVLRSMDEDVQAEAGRAGINHLDAQFKELMVEMNELTTKPRADRQHTNGQSEALDESPTPRSGANGEHTAATEDEAASDEFDDGDDGLSMGLRHIAGMPPVGGGAKADAPSVHLPMPPEMAVAACTSTDGGIFSSGEGARGLRPVAESASSAPQTSNSDLDTVFSVDSVLQPWASDYGVHRLNESVSPLVSAKKVEMPRLGPLPSARPPLPLPDPAERVVVPTDSSSVFTELSNAPSLLHRTKAQKPASTLSPSRFRSFGIGPPAVDTSSTPYGRQALSPVRGHAIGPSSRAGSYPIRASKSWRPGGAAQNLASGPSRHCEMQVFANESKQRHKLVFGPMERSDARQRP